MNPLPADAATSALWGPLGGGAFLFVLFAGFFIAQGWRDRDRALLLVGGAVLLLAAGYSVEAFGPARPPGAPPGRPSALLALDASNLLLAIGLAQMAEPDGWRRQPLLGAALALQLLHAVLVLAGAAAGPLAMALPLAAPVLVAALLLRAARRAPGQGHALVGASLLLLPAAVVLLPALGVDPQVVRHAPVPARLVFLLVLLVVGLQRGRWQLEAEVQRRRAAEARLAEANAALERTIDARTTHLRDMLAGLEHFNREVSQDLRGPLDGIEAMAQQVGQALADGRHDEVRRLLRQLAELAEGASEGVAALLELARVGHAPLQRAPLALAALAAEVAEQLQRQAPPGRTPPAIRIGPLPVVEADAALLRTALVQLVATACAATAERTDPLVELGSGVHGGRPALFVRDNGPGLPREALATLFLPLHGLGDGGRGHAIGRAIVRRVVERHGGRLWAEPRPGGGTVVWFTLGPPAAAGAAAVHAAEDAAVEA